MYLASGSVIFGLFIIPSKASRNRRVIRSYRYSIVGMRHWSCYSIQHFIELSAHFSILHCYKCKSCRNKSNRLLKVKRGKFIVKIRTNEEDNPVIQGMSKVAARRAVTVLSTLTWNGRQQTDSLQSQKRLTYISSAAKVFCQVFINIYTRSFFLVYFTIQVGYLYGLNFPEGVVLTGPVFKFACLLAIFG